MVRADNPALCDAPLPTRPTSASAFASRSLRRQGRDFRRVDVVHAWLQSMLGQCFGEHTANLGFLIRVIDLHSAQAPTDPRHRNTLRIARRRMLEREIARRRRTDIEVLVEPR